VRAKRMIAGGREVRHNGGDMRTCRTCVALLMLSISGRSATLAQVSKITLVVYDIGADRPLVHTTIDIVVGSDCASDSKILRSSALTDGNGEFQTSLPVGRHLLSVTGPSGHPVRACVRIAPAEEISSCGGGTSQRLIVRTVTGRRPLPTDILDAHPCAAHAKSVCDPLDLPRTVHSKHLVFADDEDRPFQNRMLVFSRYSKGKGEYLGSVTTDNEGRADLSAVYVHPRAAGSLDQIVIKNSAPFLLELSPTPTNQPQRIKIVKWQCGGREHVQATSE
jgi:hypothetical protein